MNKAITDLDDSITIHKNVTGLPNTCQAPGVNDPNHKILFDEINCVLKGRVGPPGTPGNLSRQWTYVDVTQYKYISADGSQKLLPKDLRDKSLISLVAQYLRTDKANVAPDGSVSLFLIQPTFSPLLWWSGQNQINLTTGWPITQSYHEVMVAGVDLKGDKDAPYGRIYFADPDSNPDPGQPNGNENSNAGWTFANPNQVDLPMQVKDIIKAVMKRRFQANDPLPVPVKNPPTDAEIKKLYFAAAMAEDKQSFAVSDVEAFSRYNGVRILGLNRIEITKAGPAAKTNRPEDESQANGANQFEVSPGIAGAPPIDEFWVFPGDYEGMVNETPQVDPPYQYKWGCNLVQSTDPWANSRPYGGFHCKANSEAYALENVQSLSLTYRTATGKPLDAWDVVVDDATDPDSLQVQAFGAKLPQVFIQREPPAE